MFTTKVFEVLKDKGYDSAAITLAEKRNSLYKAIGKLKGQLDRENKLLSKLPQDLAKFQAKEKAATTEDAVSSAKAAIADIQDKIEKTKQNIESINKQIRDAYHKYNSLLPKE